MILDPLHYLATLGRKPGSLDHAPVFRDWELPACFADFRARLERQHGPGAGARQYARVLQLLAEHPLTRLEHGHRDLPARAARHGRGRDPADAGPSRRSRPPSVPVPGHLRVIRLDPGRRAAARPEPVRPAPERPARRQPGQRVLRLIRSSITLPGKDLADGRCHDRVAQGPAEAAPPADDGPGVREAGARRRRDQPDASPSSCCD